METHHNQVSNANLALVVLRDGRRGKAQIDCRENNHQT
jgi:hypothetical protein